MISCVQYGGHFMKQHKAIYQAWNKYVAHSTPIPNHIDGVRDEITASWKRSKAKIDPFQTQMKFASKEVLEQKLQENTLLIQIAYPYLVEFYRHLQSNDYQIVLTDSEGCQLKRISQNSQQDQMAKEIQLFDGCLFSESSVGTNGVGVCLELQKPVMVLGAEHYLKMYHNVACYSSPIYDSTHQLIGCILITGPLDSYNPMIMGMLSAAVAGIEKEFELTSAHLLLTSTMDSFNKAILILDHNSKILHYNQVLIQLLKLKQTDLTGLYLHDLIDVNSLPSILKNAENEIENYECIINNIDNEQLELSVTVKPQSMNTTLILIESQNDVHRLANQLAGFKAVATFDDLHGNSSTIQNLKLMGKVMAKAEGPMLIFGETGAGKDIVAQAIHNESDHKDGPFVTVNCSTVQKAYLEKELWGIYDDESPSERKPGKLELAHGGTLFLVEISNMSMDVQEKLVQTLQKKSFTPQGSQYEKLLHVRIIASTSKNLYSLVEKGMFRQDLYYLLNSLHLTIPPLRERKDDIYPLLAHTLKTLCESLGIEEPKFDAESLDALIHYRWPGNTRQLESVVDCALNASNGKEITLGSLPLDVVNDYYAERNSTYFHANNRAEKNNSSLHPKAQEYSQILYAIKVHKGNVKLAAESLHMSLSTLYRKLDKYSIHPKDFIH
ncbi:MAG: sigma-54-dependent Fis family transcriptional regulator [Erysipelotrichaceae bacterium]|nr:sigma-54-dependent Fis family transcriptional regulator [Erysipelotrichaceae bacterium]